jgi:hypothetical protein
LFYRRHTRGGAHTSCINFAVRFITIINKTFLFNPLIKNHAVAPILTVKIFRGKLNRINWTSPVDLYPLNKRSRHRVSRET